MSPEKLGVSDAAEQSSIKIEPVFDGQEGSVTVRGVDRDCMLAFAQHPEVEALLPEVLRIAVVQRESVLGELPDVVGAYELLSDGIRFAPHFPFDRSAVYRATFDPGTLRDLRLESGTTSEFAFPLVASTPLPVVTGIMPSGEELPENVLRFYLCFSKPMRRGTARSAISLLGPDGSPVEDALYRAPVELWNAAMDRLTVLLDPGRLKRGVGPNRELGPPLRRGCEYTLVVGVGMTDLDGVALPSEIRRRFRASEVVREAVEVDRWSVTLPAIATREPLVLGFPVPLDWALLRRAIGVVTESGKAVAGRILISEGETQWSFIPVSPWPAERYRVLVAPVLEDVCGNSLGAPFERPLGAGGYLRQADGERSIDFELRDQT